jgi:hypothetical protein
MIRNYQPIDDIIVDDGLSVSALGRLQVLCAPNDASPISVLISNIVGGSMTITQSRILRDLLERAEHDALLASIGDTCEEYH